MFVTNPMFASGMINKEEFFTMLADHSGQIYTGKEISEDLFVDPQKLIESGSLKAVAVLKKVKLPDDTISVKPMPIGTLSAENYRLFEKVSRAINNALKKSSGLSEIMPYCSEEQIVDLAEVLIQETASITNVTPAMAREMAEKQVEHSKKMKALELITSLGYKPNTKALVSPVGVSSEYLLKEDEETSPSNALLDAEVETIDV